MPPLDRRTAWGYLLSNLMLPGLGTFIARRRVTGVAQMVLAQAGFVLTLIWARWLVRESIRNRQLLLEPGPYLGLGIIGALIFLAAWLWSLVTSLQILRAASKTNP